MQKRKDSPKQATPVIVTWNDAALTHEVDGSGLVTTNSAGFFHSRDKEAVRIGMSIDCYGGFSDVLTIPVGDVLKIKRLS